MRGAERGFLLLSSSLGDPNRKPLTTAQLRTLADRSWQLERKDPDAELCPEDLFSLGYSPDMAQRILSLLSHEQQLSYYLSKARREGCVPITRVSDGYPLAVRKRLGLDSPGVLWAKGDVSLLERPKIALVGSRDIRNANREFAKEAGRQAALQGYVLVSGNARGADRIAQDACLRAGGQVIVVAADRLLDYPEREHVLVLSEEDYDLDFSAQRALSRNRLIHALGEKTLVAQCADAMGGTWDGTVKNLKNGWSPVFAFADGSAGIARLAQMGAQTVTIEQLADISSLISQQLTLF